MSVGLLDHFNIRTRKLADTVRFYEDILGLEKGDRPGGSMVLSHSLDAVKKLVAGLTSSSYRVAGWNGLARWRWMS